jgi:hypothetical protein
MNQEGSMFFFVIQVVVVSIILSILSYWIKVIPHYAKRRHAIFVQLLNTIFLTIMFSIVGIYDTYPSWYLLFGLMLFFLLLSVRITNVIARKGSPTGEPTIEDHKERD